VPTPRRGSLHSRGVAFGYDATGAIASIGTLAAFDHDLDGRPVSRTLNGVTKSFRFGGAIAYSASGNPIELDLGEVVIKLDGTGTRYRHMDFRGNVLFQTSNTGNVTGQAVYRGFGRWLASGNLGERGFAGGFEIPSLGLVVLGPRVLDSDAGRFLSQDPVFNAVNQYAYAQGNPVFMWDPTGTTSMVYDVAGFVGTVSGWGVAFATTGGNPVATVAVGIPLSTALRADAVINAYHAWHLLHLVGLADEPTPPTPFDLLGFGSGAGSTSSHGPNGGLGGGIQSGGGDPPAMPPQQPSWDFEGIETFSGAYFQIQIAIALSISVP
jgi:RHS repeat-associated protein